VTRQTTDRSYNGAQIVERELAWQVQGGKLRHEPAHLARALAELLEADAHRTDTPLEQAS
jgi:hypothetical protein